MFSGAFASCRDSGGKCLGTLAHQGRGLHAFHHNKLRFSSTSSRVNGKRVSRHSRPFMPEVEKVLLSLENNDRSYSLYVTPNTTLPHFNLETTFLNNNINSSH